MDVLSTSISNCVKRWGDGGGSPATTQIDGVIETEEVNDQQLGEHVHQGVEHEQLSSSQASSSQPSSTQSSSSQASNASEPSNVGEPTNSRDNDESNSLGSKLQFDGMLGSYKH